MDLATSQPPKTTSRPLRISLCEHEICSALVFNMSSMLEGESKSFPWVIFSDAAAGLGFTLALRPNKQRVYFCSSKFMHR